jgi:hypothetical protein
MALGGGEQPVECGVVPPPQAIEQWIAAPDVKVTHDQLNGSHHDRPFLLCILKVALGGEGRGA